MFESFSTVCPRCGADGELLVVAATLAATGERLRFRSVLHKDGFTVPVEEDIKDYSTENERVLCRACGAKFSLSEVTL